MGVTTSKVSKSPIAILVDDDATVCAALENLLNSVGIDAMTFLSGREFLEAKLPDRPSCVVLDVRMPGISGLDLQHHLTRNGVTTPVLFLTAHGDIAMSVQAMKAGAQDFLTKPVRDQTFLDAVSKAIATDVSRRNALSAADRYVSLFETLTVRERQVLKLVVSGEVNKQIAFSLGISEFTVKLHRSNMMKKMQVSSVAQLFNVWQALPSHVRMSDG